MKQINKDLIKFETVLVIILCLLVWWALSSCTKTEYITVEKVRTDTTYITKHQRDSIWLHDSVMVSEKGDTVRIEKWHTKYIEKQVHDTLYKSKTDSIPVPYPVIKEVEKKLTKTQKGLMGVGLLTLMAVIVLAGWKLKQFLP